MKVSVLVGLLTAGVLSGAPAGAGLPPTDPTECLAVVQYADDPATVEDAYRRGLAVGGERLSFHRSYMHRMIELGLPGQAEDAAVEIIDLDPRDGVAWAVLAFCDAARNDTTAALAEMATAVDYDPVDPFVMGVAGKLMAWYRYPGLGDPRELPAGLADRLDEIHAQFGTDEYYSAAYLAAYEYYASQARVPIPELPQAIIDPGFVTVAYEPAACATYTEVVYSDFAVPCFSYPYLVPRVRTYVLVERRAHRHLRFDIGGRYARYCSPVHVRRVAFERGTRHVAYHVTARVRIVPSRSVSLPLPAPRYVRTVWASRPPSRHFGPTRPPPPTPRHFARHAGPPSGRDGPAHARVAPPPTTRRGSAAPLVPLPRSRTAPPPRSDARSHAQPPSRAPSPPSPPSPPRAQPSPRTGPDVRPPTRPEVRPDVRPQVRPDVRPDVRPQVRPEVRPNIRPQVRPEVRPEVRPPSPPPAPRTSPAPRPVPQFRPELRAPRPPTRSAPTQPPRVTPRSQPDRATAPPARPLASRPRRDPHPRRKRARAVRPSHREDRRPRRPTAAAAGACVHVASPAPSGRAGSDTATPGWVGPPRIVRDGPVVSARGSRPAQPCSPRRLARPGSRLTAAARAPCSSQPAMPRGCRKSRSHVINTLRTPAGKSLAPSSARSNRVQSLHMSTEAGCPARTSTGSLLSISSRIAPRASQTHHIWPHITDSPSVRRQLSPSAGQTGPGRSRCRYRGSAPRPHRRRSSRHSCRSSSSTPCSRAPRPGPAD